MTLAKKRDLIRARLEMDNAQNARAKYKTKVSNKDVQEDLQTYQTPGPSRSTAGIYIYFAIALISISLN
jgi:hypothetical protein